MFDTTWAFGYVCCEMPISHPSMPLRMPLGLLWRIRQIRYLVDSIMKLSFVVPTLQSFFWAFFVNFTTSAAKRGLTFKKLDWDFLFWWKTCQSHLAFGKCHQKKIWTYIRFYYVILKCLNFRIFQNILIFTPNISIRFL